MKPALNLMAIVFILAIICSCNKEDAAENNGLTGKWLLVEIYNGYANGGNFKWNSIPYQNAHSLEFKANGQYIKHENSVTAFPQCTGTYQLLADSTLNVHSSCENATMKISESTNRSLIIDYPVREGVVRYKYIAER